MILENWLILICLMAVVIFGLLLFWNRSLKRQLAQQQLATAHHLSRCNLAEQALHQCKEKLELRDQLMATSQQIGGTGSWIYTIATGNIHASSHSLALFGLPENDMDYPLEVFLACIPQRDRISVVLETSIRERRAYEDQFEMIPANGQPSKIIHSIGRLETDAQGNPLRIFGFIQDVTESVRIKESLQTSEAMFRAIIEATPVPIALNDDQGNITYLNQAFVKMIGYTLDDIPTLADWWPRAYPDPQYRQWIAEQWHENLQQANNSQEVFSPMEVKVRCKDGSIRTFMVGATLIQGSFAGTHLVILYDITERKEYEAELTRSNAELEQFSYAISHDMRQPLRMISSYLQLIQIKLHTQLEGEIRDYFKTAIDGARRIDQMLMALLEYSRVGRMGEQHDFIESRAVLDEALKFLQPAITEVCAIVHINGDWPRIHASRDEILRLMQNLIANAVKYRIVDRIPEITVSCKQDNHEWCLCVADNGIGIIPDQIQRLFKVFQRLQSRADYEGTGIGLALCRKIAEHHKGRIWAESAGAGQGSRFWVALPILGDRTQA